MHFDFFFFLDVSTLLCKGNCLGYCVGLWVEGWGKTLEARLMETKGKCKIYLLQLADFSYQLQKARLVIELDLRTGFCNDANIK